MSKQPRLLLFVGIMASCMLNFAPAHAATITVTTNADSGVGSLRAAIASAAAGDTINFQANYTISLANTLAFTAVNTTAVTIDGTGHTIVIDGSASLPAAMFQFEDGAAKYVFRNLKVTGAKSHAFNLKNCSYVTLENVEIASPKLCGVYITKASNTTITNCIIHGSLQQSGISTQPFPADNVANSTIAITGCTFYSNLGTAVLPSADILLRSFTGATISNNVFGMDANGTIPALSSRSEYAIVLRGLTSNANVSGNTITYAQYAGVQVGDPFEDATGTFYIAGNSIHHIDDGSGVGVAINWHEEDGYRTPPVQPTNLALGSVTGIAPALSSVQVYVDPYLAGAHPQLTGYIGAATALANGTWTLAGDVASKFPGMYITATAATSSSTSEESLDYILAPGLRRTDVDGDCMPDDWEATFGLSSTAGSGILGVNGPLGDMDSDNYSNLMEYFKGSNPASAASTPLSPGSTTVSALIGAQEDTAAATLSAVYLYVGSTYYQASAEPAGEIIGQTPSSGASVAPGTAVDITVSSGSGVVPVPDVVGQHETAARDAIAASGLVVGTVTYQSSTKPIGQVLSQDPDAGEDAVPGAAVNLVVSASSSTGDSDGDGIPDSAEMGPNPNTPIDTDGDTTPDYLDTDSDDDSISDAIEGAPTPTNPPDTNANGVADFRDSDSDSDTIPDLEEGSGDPDADSIPNFRDLDSDDDGISDEYENNVAEGPNVDGDELPNFLDLDSDDDGFSDEKEWNIGSNPYSADSVPVPLGWIALALAMSLAGAAAVCMSPRKDARK